MNDSILTPLVVDQIVTTPEQVMRDISPREEMTGALIAVPEDDLAVPPGSGEEGGVGFSLVVIAMLVVLASVAIMRPPQGRGSQAGSD